MAIFRQIEPKFVEYMQSPDSHPKLAVVILNWNGKHYLEQFLPFVCASTYPNIIVYLADNASTDGSVDWTASQYPSIKIIRNSSNEGFAGGYNRALKHVEEEFMVLLNSDIEVSPGWIEPIMHMFMEKPDVVAIQPKILDYNNKERFEYAGAAGGWIDRFGYPFSKGRVFDVLEKDEHQYDKPAPIFWASGASLFIRHSAFDAVGGFDGYFFAHQEEIDLCWRLQLAGHRIMSCPASIIYHIGGGTLAKNNPKKIYLNFRNNLIMLWKNLEGIDAFMTVSFRFLLDAISAWKNLLSGQSYFFTAVMKAHFGFFSWLLVNQKKSIFPSKRIAKPAGRYMGSVVWQHFAKGKNRFSEIVENCS